MRKNVIAAVLALGVAVAFVVSVFGTFALVQFLAQDRFAMRSDNAEPVGAAVRMRGNVVVALADAIVTADEAVWHESTQTVELLGAVRIQVKPGHSKR